MNNLYEEIKVKHPDLYRQAIESASAIMINNKLSYKIATDIEKSMLSLIKQCLFKIEPN